jgi:hypothetical protein
MVQSVAVDTLPLMSYPLPLQSIKAALALLVIAIPITMPSAEAEAEAEADTIERIELVLFFMSFPYYLRWPNPMQAVDQKTPPPQKINLTCCSVNNNN